VLGLCRRWSWPDDKVEVEKGDFVLHLALSATQILALLPVSRQTTLMLPV
jgi:hypothetical protein